MAKNVRLGGAGLRIVRLLVNDPTRSWAGSELSKAGNIGSGTLYPLLAKLEVEGWLKAKWEDVDPKEIGRPRRRYYTLTAIGAKNARVALADLQLSSNPGGALAWTT